MRAVVNLRQGEKASGRPSRRNLPLAFLTGAALHRRPGRRPKVIAVPESRILSSAILFLDRRTCRPGIQASVGRASAAVPLGVESMVSAWMDAQPISGALSL